jgi:hypothetical protein
MSICFISYATEDLKFVENELIPLVRSIGLEPWYAKADLRAGEDYARRITDSIASCDLFILVMTPRAIQSEWVRDEIDLAIKSCGRIVQLLIETCRLDELHPRLGRLHHVDLRQKGIADWSKLVTVLVDVAARSSFRRDVQGNWSGEIHQYEGPEGGPLDYPLVMSLKTTRNDVYGEFTINYPMDGQPLHAEFNIKGSCSYERFLQLNYTSKNAGTIQFGALLLELDDVGNRARGKLLGYGAFSRRVIAGDIWIERLSKE